MTTQEINDYRVSRTLEDAYGYRPQLEEPPKDNDLLIALALFCSGVTFGIFICAAINLLRA